MIVNYKDWLMVLLKKTFAPLVKWRIWRRRKRYLKKISRNSRDLNWLENVGMKDSIKEEMKKDLKRKRRSHDKFMNLGKKQRRNEVACDEVDLEKKKDIWKAFCVS